MAQSISSVSKLSQAAVGRNRAGTLEAPDPGSFPADPQLWVFACAGSQLRPGGHMALDTSRGRLVVFRGADGQVRAIDARCPHLGSDLSAGRVVGNSIQCPYHHFRFDAEGGCSHAGLQARAYETAECFGAVFVFTGLQPAFTFPRFDEDISLVSAPAIRWSVDTPWFMVGANAFDARHFKAAHSRRLLRRAELSYPNASSIRVSYRYAIEGKSLTDRIVRLISGRECDFEVTSWYGNVLLVRADFGRDATYGLVVVQPLPQSVPRCSVTVIVSAQRGSGVSARLIDRLRARAKREAVRSLMQDDLRSLDKLDYIHDGLQPGDEEVAEYLRWVQRVSD